MHFASAPAGMVATTVQYGSRGADVRTLQDYLSQVSLLPASGVDGVFGADTLAAVRDLQSRMGIAVDGIAGPDTWVALRQAVANGLPYAAVPTTQTADPATPDANGEASEPVLVAATPRKVTPGGYLLIGAIALGIVVIASSRKG